MWGQKRTIVASLVLLLAACERGNQQADDSGAPELLLLANVTVIDGKGNPPRAGQTIEVRGGRITAVRASTPDDSATLDVAGAYVTPGLIDSHVHLNPLDSVGVRTRLDSMLRSGITTIREMACCAPDYARITGGADSASFPRVYASAFWAGSSFMRDDPRVAPFAGVGVVPWLLAVSDTTDLAMSLRKARESGAHGLKIYSDLAPTLVRRIASAARGDGMRVWSHTTVFPMRPSEVVAADIDVVSHAALLAWEGTTTLPAHYDRPHPFSAFGPRAPYSAMAPDDPRLLAVLDTMRRRGVILDPTVAVMRKAVGEDAWRWAIAVTRLALARGIPLTVGTDGVSLFDEIETLVDSVGLNPVEVVRSATSVGAAAIGVGAHSGSIEVGKVADLVVYRTDPTANIRALRSPAHVVRGGRVVEASGRGGGGS